MKTYKIHLIRHGLTQGNIDGTYVGHKDIPVCEQGIAGLKQMKQELIYPEIPALFCSPLTRCKQTSSIIYPNMEPIIINDLIEYNFGEFEGRSADELKNNEDFIAWLSGDAAAAPPFGESNGDFGKRIGNAFEKIVEGLMKTGVTEAGIVTHGGVIMGIMSMYALPELPMPEWLVPNGCGYTVMISPTLWTHAKKMEVFAEIPYEAAPSNDSPDADKYFEDDGYSFEDFMGDVMNDFNPEEV